MSRCSSFTQVKCNWYRMRTFALAVKRNNCKTSLLEAATKLLFEKKPWSLKTTTNL